MIEAGQKDGSALRTALERAVELVMQAGAKGRHWEAWLPKARAALAALPPSAPPALDADVLAKLRQR